MLARCRQPRRPLLELLEDRCVPTATPAHVYDLNTDLNDRLGGPALLSDGGTLQNGRYVYGADQQGTVPKWVTAAYMKFVRHGLGDPGTN